MSLAKRMKTSVIAVTTIILALVIAVLVLVIVLIRFIAKSRA